MFKKIISVLLITSVIFCATGCAQNKKPKGNIAFQSLDEMYETLNGTWFSVSDSFTGPTYTEIIFDDEKIKQCQVYGWKYNYDTGERTPLNDENIVFKDYGYSYRTPEFDYKTGQVLFGYDDLDIDIKINKHTGDGKEIKETYLKIGSRVYLKASDSTTPSDENFKTFQSFCAAAISNETYTLADMSYQYEDQKTNIEAGINYDNLFIFNDFDNEEISFDVTRRNYNNVHYMARTDEFEYLYNEIKDFFCHKTNIVALIGDDMPDFDKKEYYKNHTFRELKYYLYMNSEGKLVSNIVDIGNEQEEYASNDNISVEIDEKEDLNSNISSQPNDNLNSSDSIVSDSANTSSKPVVEKDPCADGHLWIDATCTTPATCSVCKKTSGNPVGHNIFATKCIVCNHVDYSKLAGTYIDAAGFYSGPYETFAMSPFIIDGSGNITFEIDGQEYSLKLVENERDYPWEAYFECYSLNGNKEPDAKCRLTVNNYEEYPSKEKFTLFILHFEWDYFNGREMYFAGEKRLS